MQVSSIVRTERRVFRVGVVPSAERGLFTARGRNRDWREATIGCIVLVHGVAEYDAKELSNGDLTRLDNYLVPIADMLGEYTVSESGLISVRNESDRVGDLGQYFHGRSILTELAPFAPTPQQLDIQA